MCMNKSFTFHECIWIYPYFLPSQDLSLLCTLCRCVLTTSIHKHSTCVTILHSYAHTHAGQVSWSSCNIEHIFAQGLLCALAPVGSCGKWHITYIWSQFICIFMYIYIYLCMYLCIYLYLTTGYELIVMSLHLKKIFYVCAHVLDWLLSHSCIYYHTVRM